MRRGGRGCPGSIHGTAAAEAVFEIESLNPAIEARLHPKPRFFIDL